MDIDYCKNIRELLGQKPIFISLEGPEGGGKSSLVKRLKNWLEDFGVSVIQTREPGGTEIGTRIRELLLDRDSKMEALCEFFLFCASRSQICHEVIVPALQNNTNVLVDRFFDSTFAYQSYGRGLDLSELRGVTRFVTNGIVPDLTLLLDIDPRLGLERAAQVGAPDRLELADLEFHHRVRQGFLELASNEPNRFAILDAELSLQEVFGQAMDRIIQCVQSR